jgi:hypothetical protein
MDAGYKVVMQESDFVPGRNFVSMIHDALEHARWIVAVMSPTYLAAKWPETEWTSAYLKGRLIPVRIVDFAPPGLLAAVIYIDMVGKEGPSAKRFFVVQMRRAVAGANRIPSNEEVAALLAPSDPRPHQTAIGVGNIQAGGDVTVISTPKVTRRNVVPRGPDDISAAKAREVQKLVHELACADMPDDEHKGYRKWYKVLMDRFDVPSYRAIPAVQADEVIDWLRRNLARVRSRLHPKGTRQWHNSKLASIWARTGERGLSGPQVHELARIALGLTETPTSLSALSDDQLELFYRYVLSHLRGRGTA